MYFTKDGSQWQLVPLEFGQVNVAASQTAVALAVSGVSGANTSYVTPWEYQILATSFSLSAAGTAGVFTIDPTIAGTAKTAGRVTVGTSTGTYTRVTREVIRGSAGDKIGVKVTTDGSWDGTTADLSVIVWVLVKVTGT